MDNIDMNDIYIGELYICEPIDIYHTHQKNDVLYKQNVKYDLENKGAINTSNDSFIVDIDKTNEVKYDKFISIFKKMGDRYICLHNNKLYYDYLQLKKDYCNNLEPINNLLPINTRLKGNVTEKQALDYYDTLFKNYKRKPSMYDQTKYNINNFYLGSLNLMIDKMGKNKYGERNMGIEESNLIPRYILQNSSYKFAQYVSSTRRSTYDLLTDDDKSYNYRIYTGLFLKNKDKFIFIPNNQEYKYGKMNGLINRVKVGDSYCNNLIPYTKIMGEYREFTSDEITIQKAAKEYKKYITI